MDPSLRRRDEVFSWSCDQPTHPRVRLRWGPWTDQAALASSLCTTGLTGSAHSGVEDRGRPARWSFVELAGEQLSADGAEVVGMHVEVADFGCCRVEFARRVRRGPCRLAHCGVFHGRPVGNRPMISNVERLPPTRASCRASVRRGRGRSEKFLDWPWSGNTPLTGKRKGAPGSRIEESGFCPSNRGAEGGDSLVEGMDTTGIRPM